MGSYVKNRLQDLALLIICLSTSVGLAQQEYQLENDSLSRKETRQELRKDFRKNNRQFFVSFSAVQAKLNTTASFDVLDGFLTANVGLENNLGLPDKKSFFTGSMMYRITPSSGIYTKYYGINRSESYVTKEDLIFLGDTLPAGSEARGYFNTQVVSAGYLLSLLKDPEAFLGAYLNIYIMSLGTGVRSDLGNIDAKVNFTAPLPNFGLVALFKLKEWLYINGNIGFFSLYLDDFNGSIYDLSARLMFKPMKWFGIDVSYQEFDIMVVFPNDDIQTTIDYNFRGPAVGLNFMF
jgi:hypothetical protein